MYWIWYPGDFERYHAMKQNFSRVERGYGWPAFWKSEGFRNRIVFRRSYKLKEETSFRVLSDAVGYVLVQNVDTKKEMKYPLNQMILCGAGENVISIHLGKIESFPCVYINGEIIFSDKLWIVEDYSEPPVNAGYSEYFVEETQNPTVWEYSEKVYYPVCVEEVNNGVLYELETELTAVIEVKPLYDCLPVRVFCGESREEALDLEHCYYSWIPDQISGRCPCCAVRYFFIPQCRKNDLEVRAIYQYVDIPIRADFNSSDMLVNRIWNVASHTFKLCSGIFFLDGIKRDKWIWSGDAYQSLFTNQYLMADSDINRRTLVALRGNDPITTHINTIIDYSLYWILGIREHYLTYGDIEFLEMVYPKMVSLMEFCESQVDENGFFTGRAGDWVYIDWADMDKTGALCAEQMLFAQSWKTMALVSEALGKNSGFYRDKAEQIINQIDRFFWNEEKSAYIDSYISGKKNVTRHANIFAVLFDIAGEKRKKKIVENVFLNEKIPQITTPYFKFFELDALCKMGYLDKVFAMIKDYWGGMLEKGAVTFWEEYNPSISEKEQYDMYGDKFGKSLCHAWSASPIYLLGKYYIGLSITDAESDTYEIHPHLGYFETLECTLPVGRKQVHVRWRKQTGELKITEEPWGISKKHS